MSSAQCLQCGAVLEQDFGIAPCASCGAMMMIDMDGVVHLAEQSGDLSDDIETANTENIQSDEIDVYQNEAAQDFVGISEEINSEFSSRDATPADAFVEEEIQSPENPIQESSTDNNFETPTEAFASIAAFANQDTEVQALQFDLSITGVDHKDFLVEIMKVLSDPRLFLNTKDLQPVGGQINISGLSAARASLIVKRLLHLPVQFSWRQRLYEG